MADRTLFILAGEASGDRIGAALIEDLRARKAPLRVIGVGGEALAEQGVESLYPMDDLAVMGVADVVRRLPLLLWRAHQTVRAILAADPDIVVLVDAQVFSQVVARRLRRKGYRKPILLYVAPAVWAWHPDRAKKIAPLYDEVLAILPFEPDVMRRLGGPPTIFVGHPALARFPSRQGAPDRGPLLLLPGSRRGELRRHLPMMRAVAEALSGHPAVSGFVIPTPRVQKDRVEAAIADWAVPVRVICAEADRREALSAAVAAFVVSGTATLELALAGVPMAATYIAEAAQVRDYLKFKSGFVALPNIILKEGLVPEALFADPDDAKAIEIVRRLLEDRAMRDRQREGFERIRAQLDTGLPSDPRGSAADRVLAHLEGR